uniref:F-box domain-containing protein n=1 Tax=Caenorhabditis tropicalis TaxID=1561998 RepID=A0A1I7UTL3_9PELO
MNLLRLPLLVLVDIFKKMGFREKFLISFLSKRAKKTLKMTCVIPHFSFHLFHNLHIETEKSSWDSNTRIQTGTCCIEGEEMRLSISSNTLILRDEPHRKWLLLAGHLLDTFKISTTSLEFNDTPPCVTLDFLKMINERPHCIRSVAYCRNVTRYSRFIPRIMDECTEVTDLIWIDAIVPDNVVYTPPRPFKAKELRVWKATGWFNFESFMISLRIDVGLEYIANRTAQSYNSFFTKWMDSDTRLQEVTLSNIKHSEYKKIMDALNNQGTQRTLENDWIEVKRRNGSEFFFRRTSMSIDIYTKKAYLEVLKEKKN